MKGIKLTTILLSATLFGGCLGAFCAQNAISARAEGSVPTITTQNSELFLPTSYEQYLALTDPADAAQNDSYIAIADGVTLYVYDRAAQKYTKYVHSTEITKIGFADNSRLYFADGGLNLYLLDATTMTGTKAEVNSSTFFIHDNTFYNATVASGQTTILSYSVAGSLTVASGTEIDKNTNTANPSVTFWKGGLICAYPSNALYYSEAQGNVNFILSNDLNKTNGLSSVCAFGDKLYYTAANGLYRFDHGEGTLQGDSTLLLAQKELSALTVYNDELYCLQGKSFRKLSVTDEGATFTDYEICASSASQNRLGKGANTARSGNLLVTADAGNKRISLYDMTNESYSLISCDYTPSLVAVDCSNEKTTVAVTDGANTLVVYENGAEKFRATASMNVTGVACVYGSVYYTTSNNGYGKAEKAGTLTPSYRGAAPLALTSDVYGNLYVADASGKVYRYTEAEFTDQAFTLDKATDCEVTLPADFTSFKADFEGNLYCLSGNNLYQNGKILATVAIDGLVYRDSLGSPSSFALGFEDNELYLLYDNFTVATSAIDFPVLSKLSYGSVPQSVFAPQDTLKIVEVSAGSVGIQTNLEQLKDATDGYFPYAGYERMNEKARGVLLAETGGYLLVSLFDSQTHSYTAKLFQKEKNVVTEVAKTEYLTEENAVRYTTNALSPVYFPCMDPALRASTLSRAQKVTMLASVKDIDNSSYAYALVQYEIDGTVLTGYVPLSYLTAAAPLPPAETFRLAHLKASETGVLFTAADGATVTVKERTQIYLSEEGDLLTAKITVEGKTYAAQLAKDAVEQPFSDALRISLIVVLCVLAAVIVGAYVFLIPKKKRS